MSHAVPALGAALLTAAGSVWYLPALADLRAGADRPLSRRFGAAACLSGWTAVAAAAVVLLLVETWWAPAAVTAAGAAVAGCLRFRAAVQHGHEGRETARHWAALRHAPPAAGTGVGRASGVFAALLALGLVAGAFTEALLLAPGLEDGRNWRTAAAASAGVVGLFLTAAITHLRTTRRTVPGHPRPRR